MLVGAIGGTCRRCRIADIDEGWRRLPYQAVKVDGASLLLLNEGRTEQCKPRAFSFDCLLDCCTSANHANAKTTTAFQCDHCAQAAIEWPAFRTCEATDLHRAPDGRQYRLLDPQGRVGACELQNIDGVSATQQRGLHTIDANQASVELTVGHIGQSIIGCLTGRSDTTERHHAWGRAMSITTAADAPHATAQYGNAAMGMG